MVCRGVKTPHFKSNPLFEQAPPFPKIPELPSPLPPLSRLNFQVILNFIAESSSTHMVHP